MELVTGHSGTNHISSADVACMLRCMYGSTDGVYDVDGKMACTVQSANTVEVATGAMSTQGYFSRIDIAEQLTIDSGSPGYKRNDLVVARYELGEGNVQSMTLAVVKGTPTTQATATDPSLTEGSIDGGDVLAEFALWRVPIDGTSVGTPERVLPLLTPFQAKASAQDTAIQTLQDSVIKTTTYSVTTGNQKHGDFYYADVDDTISFYTRIISVIPIKADYNRASFAMVCASGALRVFCDSPNSLVKIRAAYI